MPGVELYGGFTRVGKNIAIVVVNPRTLLREGLASLLQNSGFQVIASAARASELKDVPIPSGRRVLSIVGIDDSGPGLNEAADNIKSLRLRFAETKIVLVAETSRPLHMGQIVALTPNGYVANLYSRDILLGVIELVLLDQQAFVFSNSASLVLTSEKAAQDRYYERSVASNHAPLNLQPLTPGENPRLSDREKQILGRLAKGNSNKEIARLFNITESTVKVHLKAILCKIAARNRTQAAIWALARGYHCLIDSSEASSLQQRGLDIRPHSESVGLENSNRAPLIRLEDVSTHRNGNSSSS
jgi:two-component system, NarL family, nitrate/nitrite response regulator NarL